MTNGGNGVSVTVQLSGHSVDARDVRGWEELLWKTMVRVRIKGDQTTLISKVAHGSSHQKGIRVMSSTDDQIKFRVQHGENNTAWELIWKIPPWVKDRDKFRKEITKAAQQVSQEMRCKKSGRNRRKSEKNTTMVPLPSPPQESGDQNLIKEKAMDETKEGVTNWGIVLRQLKELFNGEDFRAAAITEDVAHVLEVKKKNLVSAIGCWSKRRDMLAVVEEPTKDGSPKTKFVLYRWIDEGATETRTRRKPGRPCRTDLRPVNPVPPSPAVPLSRVEQCRSTLRQIADEIGSLEAKRAELSAELERINNQLGVLADEDTRAREELDAALVEEAQQRYDQFLASLAPEIRERSDLVRILTAPRARQTSEAHEIICIPMPPKEDDSF